MKNAIENERTTPVPKTTGACIAANIGQSAVNDLPVVGRLTSGDMARLAC
jgi:hypothetical protein